MQLHLIMYGEGGGAKFASDTHYGKKVLWVIFFFSYFSKSSDIGVEGGVNGGFFLIKSKRNDLGMVRWGGGR